MTPLKAIREKCLDCCCGSAKEVKLCELTTCALHPFRFGKNSLVKRNLSEEQRQAAAERLRKARENKNRN